jgi:DNA polymerase III delta subunit
MPFGKLLWIARATRVVMGAFCFVVREVQTDKVHGLRKWFQSRARSLVVRVTLKWLFFFFGFSNVS